MEKNDAIIYEVAEADHFRHISNENEVISCVYDFWLTNIVLPNGRIKNG